MTATRLRHNPKPGTCRVCGCVDARACAGGCRWVDAEHTLCSACSGTPADLAYALKSVATLRGKASRPALAIKMAVAFANDALARLDARSKLMLQNLERCHGALRKT